MKAFIPNLILLLGLTTTLLGETPDQYVTQARGFLVQNDPVGAKARLESALALSPNHPDANVLMAAVRLLAIANTSEGSALLDRLGFSDSGRNAYNWLSTVPKDARGVHLVPLHFSADELTAFFRATVLPSLRASEANLSVITNSNYLLLFSARETTRGRVNVDFGDVQLLRSFLKLGECIGSTLYAWNLNVQLSVIRSYLTNEEATVQQFIESNPAWLTFSNTNDLIVARSALLGAMSLYADASAVIRARPEPSIRLFNLDVDQRRNEESLRRTILDLKSSLSAPVVLSTHSNITLHLARLFDATTPPRALFPEFLDNSLLLGSLPDPTFGGLIEGLQRTTTEEFLARYLDVALPIREAHVVSPGQFEIRFPTRPGKAYAIECSTNLVDWIEVLEFFSSGGERSFTDAAVPELTSRYYRLIDLSDFLSLAGQVVDDCSGQAVANASITTRSEDHTAKTENTGHFFLQTRSSPNPLDVEVQVRAEGYDTAELTLSGLTDWQNLTLTLHALIGNPPSNDRFVDRSTLSGMPTEVTGSTCGATRELSEPYGTGGSVWWEWIAPFTGRAVLAVRSTIGGLEPLVSVYSGNSLATLNEVGSYEFDVGIGQHYQLRFQAWGDPGPFRFSIADAPALQLTSPLPGGTFAGPLDIPIRATFTTASSSLREALISVNGHQIARITNGVIDHLWQKVSPGFYWIVVEASSSSSRYASDTAFITVHPFNDNFANRLPLTGAQFSVEGDNSLASHEPGEPNHAIAYAQSSVWWTWTAPASGTVTLRATSQTRHSGNASVLAVYTGSSLQTLSLVASNFAGTPHGSQLSFLASKGVTYPIAVDGLPGGPLQLALATGVAPTISILSPTQDQRFMVGKPIDIEIAANDIDGLLQNASFADHSGVLANVPISGQTASATWRFTGSATLGNYEIVASVLDNQGLISYGKVRFAVRLPPPVNDLFNDRLLLSGINATTTGSNVGASRELGEASHFGTTGGQSVWWTWTAPSNGTCVVDTMGSSFNTILAIYTGTTLPQLIRVASNDDSDGSTASRVSFPVTAGVSYPIAVDGVGEDEGSIALHLALTPNQPPQIVTQPQSKVVPEGEIVSFAVDAIGTPPLNYQWRKNETNISDATQSSYTIASVSSTSTGAYSVVVSNSEGTTVSSNAVLEVILRPPPVNDLFNDRLLLSGINATTTGSNVGASRELGEASHFGTTGGQSVWWTWTAPSNGTCVVDTMGSSFNTILAIYTGTTLPQLIRVASNDDSDGSTASRVSFPATAGVSYPIAVDGVGKAKGNIALHLALTPSQPPVIVTQPLSKVVPDAGSVTFAVDAIGTAPLQYQWRKDGSNIINAAQSSYTIASVSPTGAGAYSVVVSNSEGTTVSSNAVLEILLLKPQISIQPTSTTTYLGGSFQLFVVATGSSPLSYQWRREGTNIVAATNSLYRVDRAQPNQEGAYKVVVSNSQGSVTSQVAVLTFVVESAPVIARTTFANGLIQLVVQFLSSGRAYEIQTSDDLTGSTWVPGLTLPAITSPFVVSFPLGANTSKRFFRVRDLTSGLYSSNTVGILNQTALGNYSLNFIGNPLRRSSGSTLNELFSSSDTDSTFYKLGSTSGGTYEYSDTFSSPSSPAWDPDLSFNPGEGGILVVGNEQPVTMVGEVMQGSVTNILPSGRSLCSSILPVNGLVGFPSVKGDVVHRMNPSTGSFDTYSYNGTSWSPGTPPVLAGESFWVDLTSARTWVQQLDLGGTPSHYSITRQAYTGGPTDWVP